MGSSSDEDAEGEGPTLYDKPRPAPTRADGAVPPAGQGMATPQTVTRTPTRTPSRVATPLTSAPGATMVTAADALRDEEVQRTRVFIRLGWAVTAAGLAAVPFVDGEPTVTIAYVAALVLGVVVSVGYHQAFRDPSRFTPRAMFVLAVMSIVNTHVAILFFGAFTLAPVLIVIGLHFMGRSELPARRAVYATAVVCHAAIAIALIAGRLPDPGVFATARPLGVGAYVIGAVYVQAAYALAYYTGKIQRTASLRSIEQLRRATRVASQRAALLDELRADLARAQQQGAGRYTGELLGGYQLGAIIGRGAHGEVYAATHVATEAPAAVKLLRREQLVDRTTFERFVREVKATGAASSPHIVQVLATSEPGAALPFLAMERLTGLTLADQLRRRATLPAADVVALVTQVGAAIDAAAAAGIVHRDLKPHNLFAAAGARPTWKVLDYGVAALADGAGELTCGGVVGTPHYMAPEQARGERVDHRADLYALGAIAYRALAGRNPFGGADTAAVLYNVIHAMPLAPSALAELPPDLDRWVALALAKDRDQRWDTGAALAAALAAAVQSELPAAARDAADAILRATPWRVAA